MTASRATPAAKRTRRAAEGRPRTLPNLKGYVFVSVTRVLVADSHDTGCTRFYVFIRQAFRCNLLSLDIGSSIDIKQSFLFILLY